MLIKSFNQMKQISKILSILFFILGGVSVSAQAYLMWNEVETQRFGKETLYKDKSGNLLDGHYKIAERSGAYSDLHFKNGKKDGKSTDYDFKERVIKKATYKNGKTNGKYTTYHQNGKIRTEGDFDMGKLDGEWRSYDDKGKLKTIENYKKGKKDGKWWKEIDQQTQSKSYITEFYKDDIPFGHWEEKGDDGKLRWERDYKNQDSYTQKKYHSNGKLYMQYTLLNDELEGERLEYDPEGVLLARMVFKEGQPQLSESFFENGQKEKVINYAHGKLNGVYQEFTEEGVKIVEGNHKDDFREGVWRFFEPRKGNPKEDVTYKGGKKNGLYKLYNEAKGVEIEGSYRNGEKDGLWKTYRLDGSLSQETQYQLGKEVSNKTYN